MEAMMTDRDCLQGRRLLVPTAALERMLADNAAA